MCIVSRRPIAMFVALVVDAVAAPATRAQDVRVTVLAILASDQKQPEDPRLKDLAAEVHKREPTLNGFRLGNTVTKEINVGQKETIPLVPEKSSADVKVIATNTTRKRVTLEVKPPNGGAFTYETAYDKFFPYVTREIINGERLIIAVMVKPAR
jgi:hypothetical protein